MYRNLASGTVSSGGLVTTTSENQEFSFSSNGFLNSIIIKAGSSNITVKINSETVTHPISAGESLTFSDLRILKFTVVENNVEVQYTGTYL